MLAHLIWESLGRFFALLIVALAVHEAVGFVVRWITDPRPDVPDESLDWFDRVAETVPLPGGGR